MTKKRNCRKCNEIIPYRTKIDGKIRNLLNRKFCLKCSPFGGHNTKRNDPSEPSKSASNYKNWSEERKKRHRLKVSEKGFSRKKMLVELSGGKCQKCEFIGPQRCMTFHHREPEEKRFCLGETDIRSRKWEEVLAEHSKCDLLCIRCHLELEDSLSEIKFT